MTGLRHWVHRWEPRGPSVWMGGCGSGGKAASAAGQRVWALSGG